MREVTGGRVYVLSDSDIALMRRLLALGVAAHESRNGGRSAAARRLLAGFAEGGRETSDLREHDAGETTKPADGLVVAASPLVDVKHAARALGLSEQMVRRLCQRDRLIAELTRAGWRIDPESVAELAAARKET